MKELEKVPKDLKGSATLQVEQQYDGLVGHHWKERSIGLANFVCLSTGECQGQEVGVGGQGSGGGGYEGLLGQHLKWK